MISVSIWEKEAFYLKQDIVIVGGGFMGLWTALELKKAKPKLKITILEKNLIPLGASTRNAGFACFGSPSELLYDAAIWGEDELWKIVEARYKGIQKIKAHFTDDIIDYDTCGGYECFSTSDDTIYDKLNELNKNLQRITGEISCFSKRNERLEPLGLTGFSDLIENKLEGVLHSGKLLKCLLQKVQDAGVQILYGATFNSYVSIHSSLKEISFNNKSIQTTSLIFCTNAFTNQLLKGIDIVPARGQIILTSSIPNLKLRGSFHFDSGFYYWRHLGDRILLGGARNIAIEEEETTDFSTSNTIQNELETFLQQHIASAYQYGIEHRWSGVMGFSENKKPLLKKIDENVFVGMACNGMGVALIPIFSEDLCKSVLDNFS